MSRIHLENEQEDRVIGVRRAEQRWCALSRGIIQSVLANAASCQPASASLVTISRMPSRVLLVEDESSISEPLADHLGREGFDATVAPSLADARAAFDELEPEIVLLDVMLPDGDGRELCRELRSRSDVIILMLTARGEEIDRVVGLELGADDYVVKPFSAAELVARMRAIQRRGRATTARRSPIDIGDLSLDPSARVVTKRGREIELTAKEFDLLRLLMSRAGEVVGREEIMD